MIVDELRRLLPDEDAAPALSPADLADVAARLDSGDVAGASVRELLGALLDGEGSVADVVAKRGLQTAGADAVTDLVAEVLSEFPDEVARFRAGEGKLMGFLVGQAMRRAAGRADGKSVKAALMAALK